MHVGHRRRCVLRRLGVVLENGKELVVGMDVALDGAGTVERDATRGERRAKSTLLPAKRIDR